MDRDGTRAGFDLALLGAVCRAVRLPVVASGGCRCPEPLRRWRADRCHRPARRQRVPFWRVHGRRGQACAISSRPSGSHGSFGLMYGCTDGAPDTRASRTAGAAPSLAKKLEKKQNSAKHSAGATIPSVGTTPEVLDRLWQVVLDRRNADPAVSHSARLLSRGVPKIAQKFGEEAVEWPDRSRRRQPRGADFRERRCALPSARALGVIQRAPIRSLGRARTARGRVGHCRESRPEGAGRGRRHSENTVKERTAFSKKAAKKAFVHLASDSPERLSRDSQKFFGSFFQKRTRCLLCSRRNRNLFNIRQHRRAPAARHVGGGGTMRSRPYFFGMSVHPT